MVSEAVALGLDRFLVFGAGLSRASVFPRNHGGFDRRPAEFIDRYRTPDKAHSPSDAPSPFLYAAHSPSNAPSSVRGFGALALESQVRLTRVAFRRHDFGSPSPSDARAAGPGS